MFVFDGSYKNEEQVAEFFDAYMAVYEELAAAGKYPYNDSFKGRIPGIEGDNEDTAIYLLQGLRRSREMAARVAELLADGYETITEAEDRARFSHLALVPTGRMAGEYCEYHDVRLVVRNGEPYALLPKGKRSRGHLIMGRKVIAKA